MRKNCWKRWMMLLVINGVMVLGLSGCGAKEEPKKAKEEAVEAVIDKIKETDEENENEELQGEKSGESFKEKNLRKNQDNGAGDSEEAAVVQGKSETEKLLEKYYEEVLLEEEGLVELPSGYEVSIKERHLETYSIGEVFLDEYGICYHAIWDYDKDEQDELLVLVLDEDSECERSKLYAKMYEVVDGEVTEAAELESFFGWMEFDTRQSTEILLRETKDWFYLAEEATGYSSIYADGSAYAMRVAHYDGKEFVVDLAKDTGYDVYGYSEKLSTFALKFGPSFRLGKPSNKWRYTITPYAGVTFYALSDGSNNDIGARDEYGTKESKFIGGCKLAAIYDWYYFSAHFSNRECGISVGFEFEL